ncbi:MAG: c-type cytochrome [Planctomycetes bacterium]|nr:c-type cytochrome [Planctomycetota bacterium]
MRPRVVIAISLLLLAVVAGIAGAALPKPDPAPDTPPPERQHFDRELAQAYVDSGCWRCHSVSTLEREMTAAFGAPAAGARPLGPDLAGIGGLYSNGWHLAHLWRPQDVVAHSQMPEQQPSFNAIIAMQIKTIVPNRLLLRFLQSLDVPGRERATWPRGEHKLPRPGSIVAGQKLFAEFCAGCHGPEARGDGPAAKWFKQAGDKPPADIGGAKMVWRTLRAPLPSLDDIYSTITNGLPGSGMPSFARTLSDAQRSDLVAYIAELNRVTYEGYADAFEHGPIEVTPPQVTADLIARGHVLFNDGEKYACATCHGADGGGNGPLAAETTKRLGFPPRDLVRDRLRRGTFEGVYATLSLGLGIGMAGYLEADGRNSADLWALAAYVRSLNKWESRMGNRE